MCYLDAAEKGKEIGTMTKSIGGDRPLMPMANNIDSPNVFQDAIQGNTPPGVNLSVVQDVEEADGISPLFGCILFGSS